MAKATKKAKTTTPKGAVVKDEDPVLKKAAAWFKKLSDPGCSTYRTIFCRRNPKSLRHLVRGD